MDIKTITGYGIAAGVGFALGYVVFTPTPPLPTAPLAPQQPQVIGQTRWQSGYHGPSYGILPDAGIAERLYPFGQASKITQYQPSVYDASMGIKNGSNGTLVMID